VLLHWLAAVYQRDCGRGGRLGKGAGGTAKDGGLIALRRAFQQPARGRSRDVIRGDVIEGNNLNGLRVRRCSQGGHNLGSMASLVRLRNNTVPRRSAAAVV